MRAKAWVIVVLVAAACGDDGGSAGATSGTGSPTSGAGPSGTDVSSGGSGGTTDGADETSSDGSEDTGPVEPPPGAGGIVALHRLGAEPFGDSELLWFPDDAAEPSPIVLSAAGQAIAGRGRLGGDFWFYSAYDTPGDPRGGQTLFANSLLEPQAGSPTEYFAGARSFETHRDGHVALIRVADDGSKSSEVYFADVGLDLQLPTPRFTLPGPFANVEGFAPDGAYIYLEAEGAFFGADDVATEATLLLDNPCELGPPAETEIHTQGLVYWCDGPAVAGLPVSGIVSPEGTITSVVDQHDGESALPALRHNGAMVVEHLERAGLREIFFTPLGGRTLIHTTAETTGAIEVGSDLRWATVGYSGVRADGFELVSLSDGALFDRPNANRPYWHPDGHTVWARANPPEDLAVVRIDVSRDAPIDLPPIDGGFPRGATEISTVVFAPTGNGAAVVTPDPTVAGARWSWVDATEASPVAMPLHDETLHSPGRVTAPLIAPDGTGGAGLLSDGGAPGLYRVFPNEPPRLLFVPSGSSAFGFVER